MALAVSVSMVPTAALASGSGTAAGSMGAAARVAAAIPGAQAPLLFKKKKKKGSSSSAPAGLTPESADTKRQAIRDAVAADVQAENWGAAADETEDNAAVLGDPVSYQQAAEYRLKQAEKDRDIEAANAAIETATVALDIYHFYGAVDAGEAASDWLVISPAVASGSISEVEGLIERAEALIEEIEAEQQESDSGGAAPTDDGGKKKKKKKRGKAKPGTVLIAVGAGVSAIGLGGLGAGLAGLVISQQKQKEVEGIVLPGMPGDQERVDELDQEGKRANLLGYVGLGVGIGALAIGVPLIVVGVIKRKKAGGGSETARLRVAPSLSRSYGGVSLHGRF
ncbi:MAG: hypothetical protein KDK70_13725 [Myxococcales bacterium]|nr:hypothetical protein [Myxococcales bacterium]